jgi:hypothetical protein
MGVVVAGSGAPAGIWGQGGELQRVMGVVVAGRTSRKNRRSNPSRLQRVMGVVVAGSITFFRYLKKVCRCSGWRAWLSLDLPRFSRGGQLSLTGSRQPTRAAQPNRWKGRENQGTRTDLLSTVDKKLGHNTREELATELGWSTGKVAMADEVWSVNVTGYTQEEIGKAVGLDQRNVGRLIGEFPDLEKCLKLSEKEADKYPIKVGDVEQTAKNRAFYAT